MSAAATTANPDHFEVSPTERRRVIGATIVGTTIEW
ncbi:hypothetical protein HEMA109418_05245 [Helcobacillus massiliensis]|uniref:Uncharacterized protein n=1 Tax=Helcobacillus massiliensis TaxID=521392 RepID=A0A839QTA1_9MICO|nr:hypothetical protein [Helcobacillus massiliensis]